MNVEDLKEFKRIYGTSRDRDLAAQFGLTIEQVQERADEMCLGKDKKRFPCHRMPRWSQEEEQRLRDLYPEMPNADIAAELGRTVKSIVSKANKLRLKKDPKRLEDMGRDNVRWRRDRISPQE